MAREYDKIQLPTNTTDINIWRHFLKKIKESEPILEDHCAPVFSIAKTKGKRKKKSKGDTHTKATLILFGLLETINGYVYVTYLGKELINLYNEDDNCIVDTIEKTALMLRIFESWHATNLGRDIHPGKIIIELLDDPEMEGFITDHEIAYFSANKDFK